MAKITTKKLFSDSASIFIATFAPIENGVRLPTNGMIEPMLSFFLPKVKELLLLIQPHSGSDFIDPHIEEYKKGKLKKKWTLSKWAYLPIYIICRFQNDQHTHIVLKLRDFFSVLFVGYFQKKQYTYFIGLESINAIGGIWLRKWGKVERVIYYVSDYSPHRFTNPIFNTIYLWLDRFAASHADIIWDVSKAMQPARITAGLNPKKSAPEIHMPNGLYPDQIHALPINKRYPYSLVFMGSLGYENGPDLAIECLPEIIKKYPKTTLHIIGGGKNNLERLKKLAQRLHVEKKVIFHGFVVDNFDMANRVKKCYIALAPYRAIPNSVRWYADATKIRQYVASGLPVITTHVPPLGKEVAEMGAAVIAKDTKKEFAKVVIELLGNKKKYLTMSKQAQKISKANTWENEYTKSFVKVRNVL